MEWKIKERATHYYYLFVCVCMCGGAGVSKIELYKKGYKFITTADCYFYSFGTHFIPVTFHHMQNIKYTSNQHL